MRRAGIPGRSGVIVGALVALAAPLVLLLVMLLLLGGPGLTFGQFFVVWSMTAAALLVAGLFLPRHRLGSVRASPDEALADLGHRLRLAQYRVAEAPGLLTVRIGRLSAIEIRAKRGVDGSEILYEAYATSSGWSVILILLFLGWTSFLVIPLSLYLFVQVWLFARHRVAPLLRPEGRLREPRPRDDVREALVEGLAEGHRLAAEAYEAERSSYQDAVALLLFGAIVVGFLAFVGFLVWSSEPDWSSRLTASILLAGLFASAFAVSIGLLIRRRYRPRLLRYRSWVDRLRTGLAREAALSEAPEVGPSTFELLAEASREVPTWLAVTRRSWHGRPADQLLIFALGGVAFSLFAAAFVMAQTEGVLLGLWPGLGGFALAAAAYVLYRRSQLEQARATTRELSTWDQRWQGVRTKMERYLRDL